jgi:hypothetical protein
LADAFFRTTLAIRFRRKGESQLVCVEKLLDAVLEGRGERSFSGLILTGDRGYGKPQLLDALRKRGLSCVFVMPEHILQCHPFIAASRLNITRADDIESELNKWGRWAHWGRYCEPARCLSQ